MNKKSSLKQYRDWIIITDQHLGKQKNDTDAFREFLSSINWFEYHLIFLGDVFDIWAVVESVMTAPQKKMLEKLRDIRKRHQTHIIFCRGNRDIFVPKNGEKDAKTLPFDNIVADSVYLPLSPSIGLVVAHGDLINTDDRNYIRLHAVLNSSIVRAIANISPKRTIRKLLCVAEKKLRSSNVKFKKFFPAAQFTRHLIALQNAHRSENRPSDDMVFLCGHFHPADLIVKKMPGITGYVLKPWFLDRTYYILSQNGTLSEQSYRA